MLDEIQINRMTNFLNYTYTNVLRFQKYLILFDPNASKDSYIIVPVKTVSTMAGPDTLVDWEFLDCIYQNRDTTPRQVSEEQRKKIKFDASKYHDDVIMLLPYEWYAART